MSNKAELISALLRFRNLDATFDTFDGRVAAITEDGSWVITSPNQEKVPLPPLGTHRQVRMRCDGRYGDDDYMHWPQPYSKDYPHHGCILRPVTTAPLAIIWFTPSASVDFVAQGVASGLGKIRGNHIQDIEAVITPLENRVQKYQAMRLKPLAGLPPLLQAMKHALSRLKGVATTFNEMLLSLRDFQRCWLEVRALLDYMEIYKPRMDGVDTSPPTTTATTIGAFFHVHREAQDFYKAGLPFWFLHSRNKIIYQSHNILSIVDFVCPDKTIEMQDMLGGKTIFEGGANDPQKVAAIWKAARAVLSCEDPFSSPTSHTVDKVSPNSATPSSLPSSSHRTRHSKSSNPSKSAHPYTQQGRKKPQTKPSVDKDKFQSVQHAFFPQPITSWGIGLSSVDLDLRNLVHESKRSHTDGRYMFPDPRLFIGTNPDRQTKYFSVWPAIREACIYMVVSGGSTVEPMTPQHWRDMLSSTANTRRADLESIFGLVFQELGLSFNMLSALPPMSLEDPVPLRRIIWDLCQLNFHYEIMALDRRLCLGSVNHDEHQARLLACFSVDGSPSPNAFCIEYSNATKGLAAQQPQDRLPVLLALRDLFQDWQCRLPSALSKPASPPTSARVFLDSEILELEVAVAKFYCQMFFNYFGRAPAIPYRL